MNGGGRPAFLASGEQQIRGRRGDGGGGVAPREVHRFRKVARKCGLGPLVIQAAIAAND